RSPCQHLDPPAGPSPRWSVAALIQSSLNPAIPARKRFFDQRGTLTFRAGVQRGTLTFRAGVQRGTLTFRAGAQRGLPPDDGAAGPLVSDRRSAVTARGSERAGSAG